MASLVSNNNSSCDIYKVVQHNNKEIHDLYFILVYNFELIIN